MLNFKDRDANIFVSSPTVTGAVLSELNYKGMQTVSGGLNSKGLNDLFLDLSLLLPLPYTTQFYALLTELEVKLLTLEIGEGLPFQRNSRPS